MQPFEHDFIVSVASGALQGETTYGIPASITLAQAILESGWGRHVPPHSNNLFGIQAAHHAAPSTYVEADSTEFIDGKQIPVSGERWAVYPTLQAGIIAHTQLLAFNPRYARAMAARSSPYSFARELRLCGYSTTPDYEDRLWKLVIEFHLGPGLEAGARIKVLKGRPA